MTQDLLDPATFAAGHPVELYRRLRATAPVGMALPMAG